MRLMGGLGNQMFQYALGRTLSIELDTSLILDISHFENQPIAETPREYELDCFDIKSRISRKPLGPDMQPGNFLIRKKGFLPFYESSIRFNEKVLEASDQTLLVGYWQSEKYFKKNETQIREDFTFIQRLSDTKQKILEEIERTPHSVSFQIRRGDYVTNPNSNKFHGLTSMEYYDKAVDYISKKINNPVFYVISDDPKWCEENIKLNYPTVFVDSIPGAGWEDMYLTSRCRHNIIANSSFGWWGSWLNKHIDKIVIAPKKWAQDRKADYTDIALRSWIRF